MPFNYKICSQGTKEGGSILVTTLLILVVINLLAIGLMQSAAKETKLATFKSLDSSVFHITDSCIQETMKTFSDSSAPPTVLPLVINQVSMNHMFTGTETQSQLNKLANYNYSCSTNFITVQSVGGDTAGEGEEIGENSGYGAAGDLSPRYYYQTTASGNGPQSSRNTIFATVSVEY